MFAHKNINILVVDDEPVMCHLVINLLNRLGFKNVDEASDGKSALEKINLKNYGVIFSDWKMAPMDGIDLIKKIRAVGNMTPIILITSNSTAAHEAEAKKSGASEFITKNINLRELHDKMTVILGQ